MHFTWRKSALWLPSSAAGYQPLPDCRQIAEPCTLLHAERVGAFTYVGSDAETTKKVLSQCKRLARAIYRCSSISLDDCSCGYLARGS